MAGQSDNLYITDLPPNMDEDTLRTIFSSYGVVVQCKVLQSKTPGTGKCAGLVRVQSAEEAQWIVENLNGNIPQGLTSAIQVRFADSPESKAQKWGAGGGGYGKAATGNGGKGKWSSPYGGKDGGKCGCGAWGATFGKGGKGKDKGGG